MAHARILVPSYFATVEKIGKQAAAEWLTKQIKKLEPFYGKGVDQRIRGYMRQIHEGDA